MGVRVIDGKIELECPTHRTFMSACETFQAKDANRLYEAFMRDGVVKFWGFYNDHVHVTLRKKAI